MKPVAPRYHNITYHTITESISRRSVSQHLIQKVVCFVCNEKRSSDKNSFNDGGLGRCTEDRSAHKLVTRKEEYLKDPDHRFYVAANRLQIAISGESHDIFAADIFYHQSCYLRFTTSVMPSSVQAEEDEETAKIDVMNEFYGIIRKKNIREKNAYLLNELLKEIIDISEDKDVGCPVGSTSVLKKRLASEFQDRLGFYSTGRVVIVYSSDMNPLEYTLEKVMACEVKI